MSLRAVTAHVSAIRIDPPLRRDICAVIAAARPPTGSAQALLDLLTADLNSRRGQTGAVVIGSGATAATLIPAIAAEAQHVTMLQRSPTYFYAPPTTHELAVTLGPLDLPDEWMRRHRHRLQPVGPR